MTNKYSKNAQGEWLHEVADWETKRRDEFVPSVGFSLWAIFFVLIGFRILDGIADWAVGL